MAIEAGAELSPIERMLRNHTDVQYLSSARVTYDRFPDDELYGWMYTDLKNGVHRQFRSARAGDWGMKLIAECFRYHVRGRRRVMDLGTGGGWPAYWVEDAVGEVIGVDESPRMIELANAARTAHPESRCRFVCAKGSELPFEDQSFDAVMMDNVLEFTQQPQAMLKEVRRVLASDGVVVSKTTNWTAAYLRRYGGFGAEPRVLYPASETRVVRSGSDRLVKHRRCSASPAEELTYFFRLKDPTLADRFADSANRENWDACRDILREPGVDWVQCAVCRQYVPETLLELWREAGFDVQMMHGCRRVGSSFAVALHECSRAAFAAARTFWFDATVKALVRVAIKSDPRRDLDMVVVARVSDDQ